MADRPTIVSEADIVKDAESVSVQTREFGNSCPIARTAAYRVNDGVVIRYTTKQCSGFGAVQTKLFTAKGSFDMSEIANVRLDERPLTADYYFTKGRDLLIKYATPQKLSDEDINNSGMLRSMCVSFDCFIDYKAIEGINQAKATAAAVNAKATLSSISDPSHYPLLTSNPTAKSTSFYVESGSLSSIDWYVNGLKEGEKRKKTFRQDFLKYLLGHWLYSYETNFSSPFEKTDFEKALNAERSEFVDRLFDYPAKPLPQKLISFTPITLVDYQNGFLKISTCCDNYDVSFPSDKLTDTIISIANQGRLASTGRVTPVRFARFFNGDDNNAPIYSLSRGLPSYLVIKVPENTARALYDIAENADKGKILSAKIAYGAPNIKSFSEASVEYSISAKSVCIFDRVGKDPLFCTDMN